jgi:hypothetical protein
MFSAQDAQQHGVAIQGVVVASASSRTCHGLGPGLAAPCSPSRPAQRSQRMSYPTLPSCRAIPLPSRAGRPWSQCPLSAPSNAEHAKLCNACTDPPRHPESPRDKQHPEPPRDKQHPEPPRGKHHPEPPRGKQHPEPPWEKQQDPG